VVGAVLAAFAGIGVFVLNEMKSRPDLDARLCPIKSGPSAVTSILIDRTDGLNPVQATALSDWVRSWAGDVQEGGAFKVYEVGSGGALLSPVVDICNPGSSEGKSDLINNKRKLDERYEKGFKQKIEQLLHDMQTDKTAKTSPIMEGIQAIAVSDFGPAAPEVRKLIIVSDLLQNGPSLSLYKSVPDAETFLSSPAGSSLRSNLSGVDVSVFILNRKAEASKQTDALGMFWMNWLTGQGASVTEQRRIPG
jgi:hypothetical protein